MAGSSETRVDLLVCSLPLHRHSYIGFILAFASSIHNKQLLGPGCFPKRVHDVPLSLLWTESGATTG
jgi:hypothetical protein